MVEVNTIVITGDVYGRIEGSKIWQFARSSAATGGHQAAPQRRRRAFVSDRSARWRLSAHALRPRIRKENRESRGYNQALSEYAPRTCQMKKPVWVEERDVVALHD